MIIKVNFFYERRTIQIQSTDAEEMSIIFKKFLNKLNSNLTINDFNFFYEGHKLSLDSTISKNNFIKKDEEIIIFAERKLGIIKCPKCICNDCIIKIENYRLTFSGCKYNHIENLIFDQYEQSQKLETSKIVCSTNGCKRNLGNSDFYKCLNCTKLLGHTKYYCNKCTSLHDKSHTTIKYDEKNYYCEKYFHKFVMYCFTCKKNLCQDCVDEHKDHKTKSFDLMSPNIKEIKGTLKKIKENIGNLRHIIEDIKESLDGAMNLYEKYCEISYDIIEKYELYNKNLKNYRILKSIHNLEKSTGKIKDDLNRIVNEKNLKDKICELIDIYQGDRNDYKDGINNKINNNNDSDDDLYEKNNNPLTERDINKNYGIQKILGYQNECKSGNSNKNKSMRNIKNK